MSARATEPGVPRPTYHALAEAAVDASGAERGWLLQVDADALVVVAAVGGPEPGRHVGTRRPIAGSAGLAASAGQPAAIQTRGEDAANEGAGGADGIPASILAVPCGHDEVNGVLEVVDAADGAFSYDAVEIVTLLAEVAGAALFEDDDSSRPVVSPTEVGNELRALADSDPRRYAEVAGAITMLLG